MPALATTNVHPLRASAAKCFVANSAVSVTPVVRIVEGFAGCATVNGNGTRLAEILYMMYMHCIILTHLIPCE